MLSYINRKSSKNPPSFSEGGFFWIYMAVPLGIEPRSTALETATLTIVLWDYETEELYRLMIFVNICQENPSKKDNMNRGNPLHFVKFPYDVIITFALMELIIIFFLTLLNGFFALSEIALVSAKKSKIEHLAGRGDKRAKIVLELRENPEWFLSSVQVGITLIGIIAGAYGGSAVAGYIGHIIGAIPLLSGHTEWLSLLIAIGGITYFSIVIGELVPKSIAMNNPERIALLCVPILIYFMKITHPFVRLLSYSTTIILKLLGVQDKAEEKISEEELISVLKTAGKQWVINREEGEMHNNVGSCLEDFNKIKIF